MTSLNDISAAVCSAFKVTDVDLRGPCRALPVSRPRFAAFHLAREVRGFPLPQIAKRFCKHHTSVMYGVEQAERLIAENEEFSGKYHIAKALIGSRRALVFSTTRNEKGE